MGIEIERKFLLVNNDWKHGAGGILYRQGYLSSIKERTVRIRIIEQNAYLTIKGVNDGIRRVEFEYEIPLADAEFMLAKLCEQDIIEKYRYRISYEGLIWEIDEFLGANKGLVVAEVELASEEQTIILPPWVGREVSGDYRYFNSALSKHPFTQW